MLPGGGALVFGFVFDGEHLEVERGFEHAVHGGDGGDGGGDGGGEAGLGGDDEGKAVLGVARALEERVDVGADTGECAGDGGDNSGLVVDDEAEVVRREELAGNLHGLAGEGDGGGVLRDGKEVRDDGDGGGIAAGSVAGEDDVSAELAGGNDHVLGAVRPGDGGGEGDKHGGDAGLDEGGCRAGGELGTRDLADGAAELAGVLEVDDGDGRDALGGDAVGVELGVEGNAGKDAELGAGVEAVDVGGRVGFGVAGGLCLGERVGVGGAGLHVRQDEVAGAVDDAGEAGDAVALQALERRGDDGNAAGDGCVEAEVRAVLLGDFGESGAAIGDELLVSGDDRFA